MGPDDRILCAATLGRAPFRERVAAAAAAGFTAVSLFPTDFDVARQQGLSDDHLRAVLDARGLAAAYVDPLLRWVPEAAPRGVSEEGAAFLRHGPEAFFAMATAVRAPGVSCALATDAPIPRDRLVEAFAALCDAAAAHGLAVHVEFLPWTAIPDLPGALAVVREAGRPNGGVLFDAWHHYRGGGGLAELQDVEGARITAVQLDDAPRTADDDPIEETLHRRRLPGEGDIPLADWVRALRDAGCRAPLGIEVFSDALAELPADEVAQRAATALASVEVSA